MSALTNAGVEIEVEGTEYTLSPLTFSDLEWLELRLQARAIEAGRLSIPDDVSPKQRSEMMDVILTNAQKINVFSNIEKLSNPTGFVWIVYRFLHHKHPDLTMDDVRDLLQNSETMKKVTAVMPLLMNFKKDPKSKGPTKTQTLAKGQRRGQRS